MQKNLDYKRERERENTPENSMGLAGLQKAVELTPANCIYSSSDYHVCVGTQCDPCVLQWPSQASLPVPAGKVHEASGHAGCSPAPPVLHQPV